MVHSQNPRGFANTTAKEGEVGGGGWNFHLKSFNVRKWKRSELFGTRVFEHCFSKSR